LAARRTRRDAGASLKHWQRRLYIVGQLSCLEAVKQCLAIRMCGRPRVEALLPGSAILRRTLDQPTSAPDNLWGYLEMLLRIKPEFTFESGELFCAKCGTVDAAGVLLSRRRPTNNCFKNDERGLAGFSFRLLN